MKKIFSIVFLSVYLFNLTGQIILYQFFLYKSDKYYNEQTSKNFYDKTELVEIAIPTKTPLIQSWNNYIQVSGRVQFKNTSYNYVKLKMTRDAIYLMCVPNYETTKPVNENVIDARQIPDIPVEKKDHVPFGKMVLVDSYNYHPLMYQFTPPIILRQHKMGEVLSHPVYLHLDIPEHPQNVELTQNAYLRLYMTVFCNSSTKMYCYCT